MQSSLEYRINLFAELSDQSAVDIKNEFKLHNRMDFEAGE